MTSPSTTAHSVRTTDDLWTQAQRRARSEGVSMNYVVNSILYGYANGLLNLPRVIRQYGSGEETAKADNH